MTKETSSADRAQQLAEQLQQAAANIKQKDLDLAEATEKLRLAKIEAARARITWHGLALQLKKIYP